MSRFGLQARAVNTITKEEHQKLELGTDIWDEVDENFSVIFVSPEMLTSPGFGRLIDSKVFQKRLFAIGVDEVHLLCSWGLQFRPAFKEIGFIRSRFRSDVVLFGMTATLPHGKQLASVKSVLKLRDGQFTLQQRSNARPDIQLIFRTIHSTQASERFPDLDWVLKSPGKTLIFCPTIRQGFKLAVYFWHLDPCGAILNKNIRLFNSLHSPHYNTATLNLLEGSPASIITIATDKLSVGVDIPDFQTVLVIDPKDLNDLWQKAGRVGRDPRLVTNPRVIVYIPKETMKAFNNPNGTSTAKKNKGKKANIKTNPDDETDTSIQEVVLAKCHVAEIDRLYSNPQSDTPCSDACKTCTERNPPAAVGESQCNCSGCMPEPVATAQAASKPRKKPAPPSVRVTKVMRAIGTKLFVEFRKAVFLRADDVLAGMVPIQAFFPESTMDAILDAFPTVLSKRTLSLIVHNGRIIPGPLSNALIDPFIADNPYLKSLGIDLLQLLWEMHVKFDDIREQAKIAAREKKRAQKQPRPFPMTDTELASLKKVESDSEGEITDEDSEDEIEQDAQLPLPKFKLHINLQ
ncbi:hypothetical protein D9619_013641 [Psilocybe cf. subviscida]|uniref:DNA 3'-5' helicase n=1 Tax=Psilocybe cf. subviscida TaxID=2480587 RepID=A0A8H5F939_9AGAR|nr:hypothetical protein D9619_013641 [Psilocybe cf. subviscida]